MADEFDNILSEVSGGTIKPDTVAAPAKPAAQPKSVASDDTADHPEAFADSEYDNEEDAEFDPNAVPVADRKKLWPKKYVNALSRRDQEATKYKNDYFAAQEKIKALEAKVNSPADAANNSATPPANNETLLKPSDQAKIDAVMKKKPDVTTFPGTWDEYTQKLVEWQSDLRETRREIDNATQAENSERSVAATRNEERIAKQTTELAEKNPEVIELIIANQDLLTTMPQQTLDIMGAAKHPELAFLALARTEGALQALSKMDAPNAALYIAKAELAGMQIMAAAQDGEGENDAEAQGTQPAQNTVSKAPAPMTPVRASNSNTVALHTMPIEKVLEILDVH